MLFIKTDTRELTINNENGEKYFDVNLPSWGEEIKASEFYKAFEELA